MPRDCEPVRSRHVDMFTAQRPHEALTASAGVGYRQLEDGRLGGALGVGAPGSPGRAWGAPLLNTQGPFLAQPMAWAWRASGALCRDVSQ
jgi:hypothetical protein